MTLVFLSTGRPVKRCDIRDPSLYHLILDTMVMTVEACADVSSPRCVRFRNHPAVVIAA